MARAYRDKAWFPSSQLKRAPSSCPLRRGLHRTSPPREDQLSRPARRHATPTALPTQVLRPAAPRPPIPNLLRPRPLTGHLLPCHHPRQTQAPPSAGPRAPARSSRLPSLLPPLPQPPLSQHQAPFSHVLQPPCRTKPLRGALPPTPGAPPHLSIPTTHDHPQNSGLCTSSSFA